METVFQRFHVDHDVRQSILSERVEPSSVASLTDGQLQSMGLDTIGDRIRFREICRDVAGGTGTHRAIRSRRRGSGSARIPLYERPVPTTRAMQSQRWTQKFVCLESHLTQDATFTSQQRQSMVKKSLWVKKITFPDLNSLTVETLERSIVSAYPALEFIPFDLCTALGSGRHQLSVINHREFTITEIRSIIGQSKVYIRPHTDLQISQSNTWLQEMSTSDYEAHFNESEQNDSVERQNQPQRAGPLTTVQHSQTVVEQRNVVGNNIERNDFDKRTRSSNSSHVGESMTRSLMAKCSMGHPLQYEHSICVICAQHVEDQRMHTDETEFTHCEKAVSTSSIGTYAKYVEIVTSTFINSKSDDENIQSVVEDNVDVMHAENNNSTDRELPTLPEVLKELVESVSGESMTFIISRRNVMRSFQESIKRVPDWFMRPVTVIFSGEEAVDEGGPKREFLRLLLIDVVEKMGILTGECGKMVFTQSLGLLREGRYLLAGQIVRWSVALGGPGLPVFMQTLFDLLVRKQPCHVKEDATHLLIDDELSILIKTIAATDSEDSYKDVVQLSQDSLLTLGLRAHKIKKDELLLILMQEKIYNRCLGFIRQFEEGLGLLLKIAKKNPLQIQSLFVHDRRSMMSYIELRKLYDISWSEVGTNRRQLEEDTIYVWECCLQRIADGEAGVTVSDLMTFWTGADTMPAIGFPKKPSIDFFTPSEGERRYPSASTCSLTLWLPRGVQEVDMLLDLVVDGVSNSFGFGKL